MQYTRLLGKYASELKYEDLPAEVIEQAKKITLHTIAVAIASMNVPTAQKAVEMVRRKGGTPEATVWGTDLKVPVEEAGFANGTTADTLDWEDCTWTGHASAGAIPAAFAMAEQQKASGKRYLEAVVAAYEVYQRIAMSVQPDLSNYFGKGKGWGLVCWQIFSSTVAAGKILGFDGDQIAAAITKGAYLTPLTLGDTGLTDTYHVAHGVSARCGINSALLTSIGFEPYLDGLDGNSGFWRQICDRVDWDWLDRDLGKNYLIMQTLLKHWPVNVWIEAPLDGLDNLCRKYQFRTEEIAKIRVSPQLDIYTDKGMSRPYVFMQAQYSVPHCFAAYLDNPFPSENWFTQESRQPEGRIAELSRLVEFFGPEMDRYEAFLIFMDRDFPETTVEVTLKNGATVTETLKYPKGHPKNNYTFEEEREHFMARTAPYIGAEKAKQFVDAIEHLEEYSNVSEVAKYLIRE